MREGEMRKTPTKEIVMRLLLAALVLFSLTSLSAFAQRRDPRYPRGPVICKATDRGWEEHFGGHRDCGSCVREHQECVETCSIQTYACTAQGRTAEGRIITFSGQGRDRWDAERDARSRCEWNRNVRGCVIRSCGPRSETVSRRACR